MTALHNTLIMLVLACVMSSSASGAGRQARIIPPLITMQLAEESSALARRYPELLNADKQPAGIHFYTINIPDAITTNMRLAHGAHSLNIPYVIHLMSAQDMDRREGINTLFVQSRLTSTPTLMHDEARQAVHRLFGYFLAQGWRVMLLHGNPRLRGKAAFDGYLSYHSSPSYMDGAYAPTLDEWMRIPAYPSWLFYADHAFLKVTMFRDLNRMDRKQPGAYMLALEITTAESRFRTMFPEQQRDNWRQYWVPHALRQRFEREQAEALARIAGLPIDTDYQDPPLPPPPPGSSNPQLPDTLTAP